MLGVWTAAVAFVGLCWAGIIWGIWELFGR
jgi:hypothetical protein